MPRTLRTAFSRGLLPGLCAYLPPLAMGWLSYAVFYPGLTHMDSQMRWKHAAQFLEGRVDHYSDWFSPYLEMVRQGWLSMGWSYASFHFWWVTLLFGSWAFAVSRMFSTPRARLVANLAVLIPFIGGHFALQAADGWVTAGFCLIAGSLAWMHRQEIANWRWLLPVLALAVGTLLAFASRFNSLLIAPLVVLFPLFLRVNWGARGGLVLLLIAMTALPRIILSAFPVENSFKKEASMAFEIIGIWKIARERTPEAVPPDFIARLPDAEQAIAAWDATHSREVIWGIPSLRPPGVGNYAQQIREDYGKTIRRFPLSFLHMRLKIMASSWGWAPRRGPLVMRTPPPDEWMKLIEVEIYHAPLWRWAYEKQSVWLKRTNSIWEGISPPWIWWLAAIALVGWNLMRRRVDAVDMMLIYLTAAYFSTLLLFSAQYIPRYNIPVWTILWLLLVRQLFVREKSVAGSSNANEPSFSASPSPSLPIASQRSAEPL